MCVVSVPMWAITTASQVCALCASLRAPSGSPQQSSQGEYDPRHPRAGRQRLHAPRTREVRDGEHARAAVVNAKGTDQPLPERTPALRVSTTARKRVRHTSSISLRLAHRYIHQRKKRKLRRERKRKRKRQAQGEVYQCHKRRSAGTAEGSRQQEKQLELHVQEEFGSEQ